MLCNHGNIHIYREEQLLASAISSSIFHSQSLPGEGGENGGVKCGVIVRSLAIGGSCIMYIIDTVNGFNWGVLKTLLYSPADGYLSYIKFLHSSTQTTHLLLNRCSFERFNFGTVMGSAKLVKIKNTSYTANGK